MKKIYLFLLVVFGYTAYGQQKGISYQAVIINPNGITAPGVNSTYVPLSNKAICLSFQIVNNNNQVEYQESQSITTDVYGMVNMVIGTGTSGTGLVTKLDAVNWNQGTKKLVVGVNTEGVCSNYTEISNQVLNYTPYSFYAQDADLKDGYVTDVKVAMGINPTKVGLGNVNNTSDANKPISIATQTALDLKENLSNKSSDIAADATSTTKYPTVKAVKDYVDANSNTNTGTIVDADTTTKGKIKLAGDLAGTADLPTVPGLVLKANIADVITALNLKANETDVVTALNLKSDAATVSTELALKLDANQKGVPNGLATLNSSGIIPSSQLPPVTISSTSVVGSDAAMTALSSATVGSIAIRTDLNRNYVLSANDPSIISNWIELLTPAAPVQSVNGYSGAVTITKTDLGLNNIDNTSDSSKPVSNATQAALNLKLDATKLGVANGTASLNALGKIPTDQIPAISFSSVKVLNSQAEMLALNSAVIGSVVIRTDENKNYVLAQANPSVQANWIELLTPAPPVQTVNGYSGNISLTKSDIGLTNLDNTSDDNKPVSAATQTALNLKANTSSLATVATTGDYRDLNNLPTAVDVSSLSGTLAIAKGGTGATTKNFLDLSTDQTISGAKTFTTNGTYSAALTVSGNLVAPNIGSSSVVDFTHRIVSAATTNTFTKLIQFGTGGLAGSNTIINIGSGISGANNAITIGSASSTATTNTTINGNVIFPTLATEGIVTNNANGVLNTTATIPVLNGGTGVSALTGYVKGNGTNAFTATNTIPSSDITGLIKKVNGSLPDADGNVAISFGTVTTGTLANRPVNVGTNGNIYVVSADTNASDNGRTYISDGTSWNEVTSNQAATDARYLQLAGGNLTGNLTIPTNTTLTITDIPTNNTDAVNKTYVDTTIANAAVSTNSAFQMVKRDALGNFAAGNITADLTGNVLGDVTGNVSGTASNVTGIVTVANGGTGADNLTGYLKGNGTTAFSSSTTIPATDITGLIKKVNGSLPDADGNVAISFGTVFTGTLANRPTISGTNGNIYVVSGDSTSTENGRTFISDGTSWNEVTSNQSATDARYLQLAGGMLSGNLVVPSSNKITLTDAPVLNTDAANKAYVDSIISSATIADASTSALGTIQLGGDLAGSGTSATSPRISSVGGSTASLLHTAEIAANAATASNTANQIVKRDGTGNFTATTITANLTGTVTGTATNVSGVVSGANGGTGVANTGKTLTLGGNFSTGHAIAFTTSGATTLSLPTSGTLATVQQVDAKELLSNKSTAVDLGNTSTSDDKYPSQKAVKTYVDGKVSSAASSAVGYSTAYNTSGQNVGNNNVGVGPSTAPSNLGYGNTYVGAGAMASGTGVYNTVIGFRALAFNSSIGSKDNVAIGQAAGYYRGSGWDVNNQLTEESIFIGSSSRAGAINQKNEIVIGYNAIGNGSNTIQLGNTAISDVKTNGKLTSGAVTYPKTHGTSGQVLSTTGSGELAWASVVDASSNQTIAGLKTFSNKVTLNSGTAGGASLEVNGASTNTAAFNAASGTSIDFTKSNLAYTSANAGAFTLTGMKDGGTYTLAVQGATSGTATFTQTGLTFTSINNAATTASKHTLYTFIVMGTTVYYSMMTGL